MVLGLILATGASVTASVLVIQVAVLPLLFRYNKGVQRKMVFSTCINFPRNLDYDNPSSSDIVGGRNFSIDFHSNVDNCKIKIGAWHIVPCSMVKEVFMVRDHINVDQRLLNELRRTSNTIVLYFHGNSNHRASPHRLQLYKVLQELDYHVITFDYRGYGDSSRVRPTEAGVVEDALAVYQWLRDNIAVKPRPMIVFWGHSLGTAVASNLVAHMAELCAAKGKPALPPPDALILEAPFNNLIDEIQGHPFSKLVSWLPYFKQSFLKPFHASREFAFTTDEYLRRAPLLPALILHARGDKIVPYQLAVKLHEDILNSREHGGAPALLHTFERGQRLGHNNLCLAPELKNVVTDFLEIAKIHRLVKPDDQVSNKTLQDSSSKVQEDNTPKVHGATIKIQEVVLKLQQSNTSIQKVRIEEQEIHELNKEQEMQELNKSERVIYELDKQEQEIYEFNEQVQKIHELNNSEQAIHEFNIKEQEIREQNKLEQEIHVFNDQEQEIHEFKEQEDQSTSNSQQIFKDSLEFEQLETSNAMVNEVVKELNNIHNLNQFYQPTADVTVA